MDKDVAYEEYRIIILLSDADLDCASVLKSNYPVQCQRKSHIMVLLDTAIVVSVQVCKLIAFIKRILLDIQPW